MELPLTHDTDRFFILTGGPGSGKSTLIQALKTVGYTSFPEAGRAIIQEHVAIGGNALPWVDVQLFAESMLNWELRSYREAQQRSGPVFFDRGVPDVAAYLRLCGLPIPAHVQKAVEMFPYHRRVFIAPPWEEIFHPDKERKQDFAEAARTFDALTTTYADSRYELIELPRTSVENRVSFVLEHLKLKTP